MDVRSQTVTITTDTTAQFSQSVSAPGPLLLHVTLDADSDIGGAADLAITDSYTGMNLLTAANFSSTALKSWTPRTLVHNSADAVQSTGSYDYQAVNQTVTVAVTGATADGQTGTLHLTFG